MTRTRHSLLATLALGGLALVLGACSGDSPMGPHQVGAPDASVAFSEAGPQATDWALLSCPSTTSASASAVIGPTGGTVSVGRFELRVPRRAVPTPTLFTFDVPASPYLEVEIHAAGVEHYQFQRSVRVTLDFSRCGNVDLDRNLLDAWYIDSNSKTLLAPMKGHVNRQRHTMEFSTDHLSGYALAD